MREVPFSSVLLLPGFEGSTCERNIDDCPNHKCQNGGVCVDGVNTYNCRCPPQWTGRCRVNPQGREWALRTCCSRCLVALIARPWVWRSPLSPCPLWSALSQTPPGNSSERRAGTGAVPDLRAELSVRQRVIWTQNMRNRCLSGNTHECTINCVYLKIPEFMVCSFSLLGQWAGTLNDIISTLSSS